MYIDIHECIENGTHLQSVDGDGYCNECGDQISAEELEECDEEEHRIYSKRINEDV